VAVSPDHLKAAQGWIELGVWDAANEELQSITPQLRAHPDVLKERFNVYLIHKRESMVRPF
jgi:hypothetical protein